MAVPVQLTTNVQNETFGGVTYHIEGELVPALHLELSNTGVYFEHHILLWKDPAVQIAMHPMKGGVQADARRACRFCSPARAGRAASPSAATARATCSACT